MFFEIVSVGSILGRVHFKPADGTLTRLDFKDLRRREFDRLRKREVDWSSHLFYVNRFLNLESPFSVAEKELSSDAKVIRMESIALYGNGT